MIHSVLYNELFENILRELSIKIPFDIVRLAKEFVTLRFEAVEDFRGLSETLLHHQKSLFGKSLPVANVRKSLRDGYFTFGYI